MLSRFIDPNARSPYSKLFWAAVGVVALVQLAALYMLCSQQMRNADARASQIQMQRTAVNDCLQYQAQSTIGSCFRQMAADTRERDLYRADDVTTATREAGAIVAVRAPIGAAIPVSFSYR